MVKPRQPPARPAGGLDYLFHPRAVAVVGASPQRPEAGPMGGMGAGFLIALKEMGFPGGLYPVNPKYAEIEGLKCYPSLLDIEGPVDHVISSVPAQVVPQLVDHCIAKGVKSIHFFTAGFSETGEEERTELEAEIVSRAKEAGIRIIGPNCMGLYCPRSGLAFMPGLPTEPGPVAFISQSGGNAGDMGYSSAPRGIRYSKVVSYGNAADLNESELLEYLAEDAETEIIAAYIEGVKDGRRFFQAMRKAAAAKPVIVLKGGRTEGGTRAVHSHTGSLAGSREVFEALCRQVGAVQVTSVDELVDLTVAFRYLGAPQGRRVAVVGGGGGFSVFAADEVNEAGLELPELPASTQEELRQFTPVAGTSLGNPVDTNVIFEPPKLADTLRIVGSAENIDVVMYHTSFAWGAWRRMTSLNIDPRFYIEAIGAGLVQAREACGKPMAVVLRQPLDATSMEHTLLFQERCWRSGFAVFPTIPRAANAIAKVVAWREGRA